MIPFRCSSDEGLSFPGPCRRCGSEASPRSAGSCSCAPTTQTARTGFPPPRTQASSLPSLYHPYPAQSLFPPSGSSRVGGPDLKVLAEASRIHRGCKATTGRANPARLLAVRIPPPCPRWKPAARSRSYSRIRWLPCSFLLPRPPGRR